MEKITMNVQDLVKAVVKNVAEDGVKTTQKEVRAILDAVGEITVEQLKQADPETSVEVKLFTGVSLVSEYVEPHEGRNPSTGETITIDGKKRVKSKLGRILKEAVNA